MSSNTDIAKRVLQQEAAALNHLADKLDASFDQAIEIIENRQKGGGRVIVTGMGKSGHVGAKIAATFASTGTPAFFVHPSEASHGDLGMITSKDVVIALSNSGEVRELSDILAYCARFAIPLIGITSKAGSTLGKASTVVLNTLVDKEACPINKAPTVSSTVTLALGDALAVTLMERNGFEAEDFANFHPGGKLGAQLKTVGEIMATGDALPIVSPNTTMDKVILEMTNKNLGCVGVVENDVLEGIITDGDIKRVMGSDILNKTAAEIMTRNPLTISPNMLAAQAVNQMQNNAKNVQVTSFFVVNDGGKPEGLLHIHHCLAAGVV